MGFSFRRSASFGPLRFNFSKSGVGASVGVKGARITMSPKGTTYITVGRGGFSYRKTLSSGGNQPRPSPIEPVQVSSNTDEIKTADVEQLLESSKSDLVNTLNERARMFNPAILLFILSALCAVLGVAQLGSSPATPLPSLPDISSSGSSERQASRIDEYALMLARYGQPSEITLTRMGSVPMRIAIWDAIHLAVTFVPAGCVDSYAYAQAHKDDPPPTHSQKKHRTQTPGEAASPSCVPPAAPTSTIVGYEDTATRSPMDSFAADRALASLSTKSEATPAVQILDAPQISNSRKKVDPPSSSVSYDEETLQNERRRLADQEVASNQAMKYGGLFFVVSLLVLIPAVITHRRNREKRITRLMYELTAAASSQQQSLDQTLAQFASSRAIWRIDSQSAVYDWKRNAGASSNVNRHQVSVRKMVPPRVESNVQPMCVDLGKLKMFFLPDQILYWQQGTFASIEYSDLNLEAGSIRFIEEHVQTSDSRQVGSTWRYVRKDGGPDRRFNNNRQLPIMLYGVVHVASSGGVNLLFHTSNLETAGSFTTSFRSFQSSRARGFDQELPRATDETKKEYPLVTSIPSAVEAAMVVLGVTPGATLDQVTTAYRHMAQMYHPDKTVGLGPELQKLADERMKEINVAHQVVRCYLEMA